jgi:hypothetical protein
MPQILFQGLMLFLKTTYFTEENIGDDLHKSPYRQIR